MRRGIVLAMLPGRLLEISASTCASASTARSAPGVVGALTTRTGIPVSGETSKMVNFAFGSLEVAETSERNPVAAMKSHTGVCEQAPRAALVEAEATAGTAITFASQRRRGPARKGERAARASESAVRRGRC